MLQYTVSRTLTARSQFAVHSQGKVFFIVIMKLLHWAESVNLKIALFNHFIFVLLLFFYFIYTDVYAVALPAPVLGLESSVPSFQRELHWYTRRV